MGVPHYMLKEKVMSVEKGSKSIYNDGYVKGHNYGWRGAVKAYSFGKPDDEFVDKLDKKYKDGYNKGYTQCIEDNSQREKYKIAEARQHHYDMGYNDALAHMASEEAEKTLELKKKGYEEGYDGGFEDGFNKAIKEMSHNQALGETTEYEFGTDGCCENHNPKKETQGDVQELLNKSSNEFTGIWVAKDNSGKLKVLSTNDGDCDVELVEHVSNSYPCVGDITTISIGDLKEHWNRGRVECDYTNTEDEQLKKELALVEKYPHYYKDIRHLNTIDIYRFFELFGVTDPCIQHSMKKLAVGGKRGAKDYEKDIKEAMDTLKRWEYMQEENKRGLGD